MRLTDALTASFCVAMGVPLACAQSLQSNDPTDTPVAILAPSAESPESLVQEWEDWLRDTPTETMRAEYATKASELIGRVELETLTPARAARLAPLFMVGGERLEGVASALDAFDDEESSEGAIARTIRLWFTAESSGAPVAPLELAELLKHPGMDAAVGEGAKGAGYALFEMLAKQLSLAGPEVAARRAERVCELLSKTDVSLGTPGLIASAKVYLTLLDSAGLSVMGSAREHLLGVYEQAALSLPENEVMQRAVMKQVTEAVAFIGGPAGGMDFSWTSENLDAGNLEALKGRVVVIDFWATWCGPCIRAFPKVRQLQEHYKDSAVTIIGVTSVQGAHHGGGKKTDTKGNPELEYRLMAGLMKDLNITWPVAFTLEPVFGEPYRVATIPHLSIVAPDGTLRANGLHPMMPDDEKHAIIDGLLEEFGFEVPGG